MRGGEPWATVTSMRQEEPGAHTYGLRFSAEASAEIRARGQAAAADPAFARASRGERLAIIRALRRN
jgi:hypothetical protein